MADLDFSLLNYNIYKDEFDVLKHAWTNQRETIFKELQSANQLNKSDKKAIELKNLGNIEFTKLKFDLANSLYFTALMTAKYNSQVYGIVFANMSACFYEMGKWTITITVIDIALESAYPMELRPKLYIRKIKAFTKNNDKVNAAKTASELEDFLKTCDLSQGKKDEFQKLIIEASNVPVDENYYYYDMELPNMEKNKDFPNVTMKALLCTDEKYGRHVIAKDVIKQGECILIEEPYAVIGLTKCANCCIIIEKSILPCKTCISTIYCSESCMISDEVIHKWECNLFQNERLHKVDLKMRLAFRIFLKRILAGYAINTKDEVDAGPDNFFNFTKLHKLALKDNIKNGRIFQYAYQCCMIMVQLSQDKPFITWIENKTNGIDSDILTIGNALLHIALICDCNAIGTPTYKPNVELSISFSFFNHSCEPNTVGGNTCSYTNMVLKALHTIQPGEQIYVSYIDHENMSKSIRQTFLLEKWNFKCDCKLCSTNKKHEGDYKCPNCNLSDTDIIEGMLNCNSCQKATLIPKKSLLLLAACIEGTQAVSANMDDESLYMITRLGNGIEINPNKDFGQQAYYEIVSRKLKSGNLKGIEKYLPHMKNFSYCNRLFSWHYRNIYQNLMNYMNTSSRLSTNLDMSTLNCLLDHINYIEMFFNLYIPCKKLLKGSNDMKVFFTTQRENIQL